MSQAKTTTEPVTVRPKGTITAENAEAFQQELCGHFEAGHTNIIIDLTDVDMIDSRGLSVFVVCHQTLKPKGGNLTVTGASEDLRGLFRVMRLDQHFTVEGA